MNSSGLTLYNAKETFLNYSHRVTVIINRLQSFWTCERQIFVVFVSTLSLLHSLVGSRLSIDLSKKRKLVIIPLRIRSRTTCWRRNWPLISSILDWTWFTLFVRLRWPLTNSQRVCFCMLHIVHSTTIIIICDKNMFESNFRFLAMRN